jgi:hypothetical protein
MPEGNLGWQSRFKVSEESLKRLNEAPPAVVCDLLEPIVLRDADGNNVDYRDTEQSHRLRRNVEEINELLRSTDFGLGRRIIREGDPLPIADVKLVATSLLYRVFNRSSFSLGGRFYGGCWQNIPKELRPDISINGIGTVEADYPRLHATLLYAELGKMMWGDPYDLENWPRELVKTAFNTLVNADTRLAALRAIANEIRGEGAFARAEMLVRAIEERHRAIAPTFGSGAGLRLMRYDSDMTESILLRLTRMGIAALPIHDSFMVIDRSKEKGELLEAMAAALRDSVGNCRRKNIAQWGMEMMVVWL